MTKQFFKIYEAHRPDRFSEETIRQLIDVLNVEYSSDSKKINDCIIDLFISKSVVTSIEDVADAKVMKGRYEKALSAIRKLEGSLNEFGAPEVETLSDLTEGFESDEALAKFDISESNPDLSGMYGVTIWETRQQLTVLSRTIEHALNRIRVPRGAKPKERERLLALFVKESLEYCEISPSTYDDGVYFRVLAIMFQECFDNVGDEAHRRHGAFALKRDIDEHDIKYLPSGSVDT